MQDAPIEKERDIWVGLDITVDNASLYKVFASRYSSVRSANVMYDRISGRSKGHAFVRFGHKFEPNRAILAINGYVGLGEYPLNVKEAVRRSEETVSEQFTFFHPFTRQTCVVDTNNWSKANAICQSHARELNEIWK